MGKIRTDLAEEAAALAAGTGASIPGVAQRQRSVWGCPVTEVEITTLAAAEQVGKPQGRYVTLHLPQGEQRQRQGAQALGEELRRLLGAENALVLVAGLGNRSMTPDAIGPWTVENILVTRHLEGGVSAVFSPVAAVSTGVMGKTGVESGELIQGIVEKIHPSLVIAVDALAARSMERLCTTIQLADTGIVPGSGVGNARQALDQRTLGVPVIAIGVPTVVDAATLAEELTGVSPTLPTTAMLVTPRDIDLQAAQAARIIAIGVNLALQGLSYEDTLALME